jgi:osmotically-inducible protein OsmY
MAVTTRIAKVDAAHGLAEVVALADDTEAGTIVLTGTVRTEQLRKKAEHLVRFEPGVREVRNEIVVASDVP